MSKQQKPRKQDGKISLDLKYENGIASIDLKEGNTPILKNKKQKFQSLNEVLDMINKKL